MGPFVWRVFAKTCEGAMASRVTTILQTRTDTLLDNCKIYPVFSYRLFSFEVSIL